MPILSDIARTKKIFFFLDKIKKTDKILEIGAGSGWAGEYLKSNNYNSYIGMDIEGTADVIGDIKNIPSLPFNPGQFDIIIAFEVIEHVDLIKECHYFLKPEGLLLLTTPLPQMDWLCFLFEQIGLNQKRTSPHSNLTNIKKLPGFSTIKYELVVLIGQLGIYNKEVYSKDDITKKI